LSVKKKETKKYTNQKVLKKSVIIIKSKGNVTYVLLPPDAVTIKLNHNAQSAMP